MPVLTINGQEVQFEPGQTILEAAAGAGIKIPTMCWLPKTGHNNVCRICSVEVQGSDRLLPACATPANEGMAVETDTPGVLAVRKEILSLIIAEGRHDCFMRKLPENKWPAYHQAAVSRRHREHPCPGDGLCRLQELALEYQVPVKDLEPEGEGEYPLDNFHPMITRDFSKCVQCGRCASVCTYIQVNDAVPPILAAGRKWPTGIRPWIMKNAPTAANASRSAPPAPFQPKKPGACPPRKINWKGCEPPVLIAESAASRSWWLRTAASSGSTAWKRPNPIRARSASRGVSAMTSSTAKKNA